MQTILYQLNDFDFYDYFEDFTYNLDIQLPNNITFQLHITQQLEILTQLDLILISNHHNQKSIFDLQTLQYI